MIKMDGNILLTLIVAIIIATLSVFLLYRKAKFCTTCGRVQTGWVNANPEYLSGLAWNV